MAEAVETATYLSNQLPSKSTFGVTPFELWYGYKSSILHCRVFGSPSYAFIPDHKRGKMDPRSEKSLLVGYMDDLKAYKLMHPQTHKATYSRSVIFNEGAVLDPPLPVDSNFDMLPVSVFDDSDDTSIIPQ